VVWAALWVVIVALAPVIVSRYDITGHELWLVSSVLALVLFVVMIIVNGRAPEHLADAADILAAAPRVAVVMVAGSTIWLPMVLLVLALALVVLGLFPDQEPALYLTAVGLGLFMGAIGLFVMVFSQGHVPAARDQSARPATGGSSA
jgi:di/tricarboxylate transporter